MHTFYITLLVFLSNIRTFTLSACLVILNNLFSYHLYEVILKTDSPDATLQSLTQFYIIHTAGISWHSWYLLPFDSGMIL